MLHYFLDSEQPSAAAFGHGGEKNGIKERKSTIAPSDKWARCLHTSRRLVHRHDAITCVCTRDAWYTTITLRSKCTFSWQTRSLCFPPLYSSVALYLHLSAFFFFYIYLFKFTFYTSVVCGCFPIRRVWDQTFSCLASDGDLVYLAVSAVSVLICIPSQQTSSKLSHVRRSRIANAPLWVLSCPISPCGMQITFSRAPVSRWHPAPFLGRDVSKRCLKCVQCILNLKQDSFV